MRSSVRQVIISAARPGSAVLPITFGLRVEMDDMRRSRWLIAEMSKLGFSVSYDETKRYKQLVISKTIRKCNCNKETRLRPMGCGQYFNAGRKKHFSWYGDYSCIHWKIMQLSYKDPQRKTEID